MTTILIIDDSETERDTYRRYVTSDRPDVYRILESDNLQDGLRLCWSEKPDAILLDFQLVNGDGLEFLKQLRQDGYPHQLPVIILTNQGDLVVAIQAMKRGAYDYLVKSTLSAEILQNSLDNLLELMKMIAERTQAKIALQESEAQFQRIAALLPGAIYIFVQRLDGSTYLEYMSAMGEEILELKIEDILQNINLFYDQVNPDDRAAKLEAVSQGAETLAPFEHEYRINVESGKSKWLQANARAVRRENGEIAWYGVFFDISDRKQIEQELLELNQLLEARVSERTQDLQEREQQLQKLSERLTLSLSSGSIGCWDWDILSDIITWDDRMYEIYGQKRSDEVISYATWINLIHPDDRGMIEVKLQSALLSQAEFQTEFRVIHPDGRIYFVESHSVIQRDVLSIAQNMIGVNIDVSEYREAEEVIRQQVERGSIIREITQKLRDTLDVSTIFATATEEIRQFLQVDRVTILEFYPDSNFAIGKFVAESLAVGFTSALGTEIHDDCFTQYAPEYEQGKVYSVNDIYNADMAKCYIDMLAPFQVRANLIVPLLKGENLWGLICIHQCSGPRTWEFLEIDLVKQIASQLAIAIQQASLYQQVQNELKANNKLFAQLTMELEQKKVLLKEIHHRVKNNLQVMSSIMYLQFRQAAPEIKALSEEYQNRIQSMAMIHDQLYRGNNLNQIDFYPYIINLTNNLFQCYRINPELVELQLEVNEISLSLDQSIPLGLIINELVSNALKYAFPSQSGIITIRLIQLGGQLSLTVADNGIGLPANFSLDNTDTLGMQLITSLTDQLEGQLVYNSDNGSIFNIIFNMV